MDAAGDMANDAVEATGEVMADAGAMAKKKACRKLFENWWDAS